MLGSENVGLDVSGEREGIFVVGELLSGAIEGRSLLGDNVGDAVGSQNGYMKNKHQLRSQRYVTREAVSTLRAHL